MYNHSLFLRTLSEFSATLLKPYDLDLVLQDLMERLRDILSLDGSGVALATDGHLAYTAAAPNHVGPLEMSQIRHQAGPCMDAFQSGSVVSISDLRTQRDRWPEYCLTAERLGLTSVAGIPMRLSGASIGALDLYAKGPRDWPSEDLAAAVVMADMATSYLINASKLRQQEQLNEHLQRALDGQAIIEQAKGVVAHAHGTTVDQAFGRIRSHARSHNVTVRAVAEAIVQLGLSI